MMRLMLLLLIFVANPVAAHKSSDSYLNLSLDDNKISMRWDIAVRDLQNVLDLDVDGNGIVHWRELRELKTEIFAYSLSRLNVLSQSTECFFNQQDLKLNQRSDGAYAVLYASSQCEENITDITVQYQLFFEVDSQHRGLLNVNGTQNDISFSFSPENSEKTFDLNVSHFADTFFVFLIEGVWHIWLGFDHILFLMCLLLPAVLLRSNKEWLGVDNFQQSLTEVIKIVTAFTVAHSLTLMLVMLGGVSLPIMMVESVIALSVIIAALNNLYPVCSQRRWLMGLVFGLIHGFGFANVLSELEFGSNALFATVFGFNLGVELGQLAIVAVFLPIAYFLRNAWFYRNIVFKLGSMSIASLGLLWFLERAL